eukprot:TRINITY_DN5936_c0_g1_i2.p1 TRINITY_DN5936_c0_g1~~TRINITY_DN5936_c0_g1_i2.p1  ORF type:complete len:448 (-),score=108.40 TRINITY_DN5936_c0_g1_i2:2522-3865(-)
MTNKQTVLRLKIKRPHQHTVDGHNHSDHANKAPISENALIDHDTISEDGLSYHREKKLCLNEEIDHHQLKNQNVYTTESDEENACSVSEEHVKEVEVPHVAESAHTCPVCRKEFKSMKSLSGHMRCHPERRWRGIQPPPTAKNSPSSTISESGGYKIHDQNDSGTTMETSPSNQPPPFFKWPVKRSRYKEGNSLLENMNEEEIRAAVNLFNLSRLDPVEWEQERRKHVVKGSDANSMGFELDKSQIQEHENTSENGFKSELAEIDDKTGIIQGPGKMDSSSKNQMQFPCKTKAEKKRKPVSSASHICRTCNKSFNSHQALGGHMTGHKNDLMTAAKVDAISVAYNTEEVQYGNSNAAESKPLPEIDATCSKAEMVHRCKTCNKTFPSGQALGGHQRCHWSGGIEASMNSVKLQEDENKVIRQIHDFDLNEPAMVEAEDDLALALGAS